MTNSAVLLFIYSNLFVPVRTSMKTKCGDKQWEPSQCPLARALISTLSNVSISGFQPIHSTPKPTPDHIAGGGGWGTRARPLSLIETDTDREGGGHDTDTGFLGHQVSSYKHVD